MEGPLAHDFVSPSVRLRAPPQAAADRTEADAYNRLFEARREAHAGADAQVADDAPDDGGSVKRRGLLGGLIGMVLPKPPMPAEPIVDCVLPSVGVVRAVPYSGQQITAVFLEEFSSHVENLMAKHTFLAARRLEKQIDDDIYAALGWKERTDG